MQFIIGFFTGVICNALLVVAFCWYDHRSTTDSINKQTLNPEDLHED